MTTAVARAEELFGRAREGDRRALGQLISLVERDEDGADALAELAQRQGGNAHVVGMTGPPGAGKSTLTGALIARYANSGRRPAVLAVDPSSPLTGGAILGDRLRMDAHASGAFVRSMATRGHRGGLAVSVPGAVRLLDATGHDPILVETVGVGQNEIDVATSADSTLLVVAPGWGDAIQANKAGLAEIADVLVVNKADRPGARDALRDLDLMLDLGAISGHVARLDQRPPVLPTIATTGAGVDEVVAALDAHHRLLAENGELDRRRARRCSREVRGRVERRLCARAAELLDSKAGRRELGAVERGEASPAMAARRIVDRLIA